MARTVITKKDMEKEGAESKLYAEELYQSERGLSAAGEVELAAGMELAGKTPQADKYTERLIKYIPAEVIALYLTLDAVIRSSDTIPVLVYWMIFIFGVFATYLYLWKIEKVDKVIQLTISAGAYCVWVFSLGGPFVHLGWYDPIYAALLLPIYTFVIPLIEA